MSSDLEIIGEIIESSTTEFAAESRELYSPPPFGSFVKVDFAAEAAGEAAPPVEPEPKSDGDFDPFRESAGRFGSTYRGIVEGELDGTAQVVSPAIYAVVHQATTTSSDSGRRPRAYWKDEQQLKEEQPELEWLLLTEFRAIVIGYAANGSIRQILPPKPPRLHSRVHLCAPEEIELVTSRMDFLRTIANFRNAPCDEAVAACIREANNARGGDLDFLVAAGKELAALLRDDYDRLQAIMRRIAL